ncbi:MAG TPA: efflux RND transporter periplasmic adaptor subunit [Flavitalea sp.]|nr:efflux RND transporter periplasmic adaptor subunit [Flavitalea sp.]
MRLLILVIMVVLFGCAQQSKQLPAEEGTYYTCSMDPQVHELKPGNCPICKMQLTKVSTIASTGTDELKLSDQQVKLGNIVVDTIRNGAIQSDISLPGTIVLDASSSQVVSSRMMGRVEKLYFKIEGEYLPKGSKFMDLYSEELNTARQEYRLLLEKKSALGNAVVDYDQLIAAAKNKLLLWGLSEAQVNALSGSKEPGSTVPFYSDKGGVIASISVREGDYVMSGATIFNLTNLSRVWVELKSYITESSVFSKGLKLEVRVPGLDTLLYGTVELQNPEINPSSRVNTIRLSLNNSNGLLKPGMPVYVRVDDQQSGKLVLPAAAVIRERGMNLVWIASGDHRFRSRMVKLGEESSDMVQIVDGLKEGEQVVTSGAWLLNSEYTLRNGTGVMAGNH